MGHDIDIVNVKTGDIVAKTYITGNFSKLGSDYPGIHEIHGHKNSTVIKLLKCSLNKLIDNNVVPFLHDHYGHKDPQKNLECYAACLQEFLRIAVELRKEYESHDDFRWYSDQVFKISRYTTYDTEGELYHSDGLEFSKEFENGSE
jgi:hypothetical protein